MIKIIVICVIVVAIVALTLSTGCLSATQKEQLKNSAHNAILSYIESKGQDKALEYINKLESEGKLGKANADKLREALPKGVDKLKEVMGELNNE